MGWSKAIYKIKNNFTTTELPDKRRIKLFNFKYRGVKKKTKKKRRYSDTDKLLLPHDVH